jgi:NADP-dependent 3-hydroxy acid dehydrogenase YdfG
VEEVTKQIIAAGGNAQAAVIDVLDDTAVNEYLNRVVTETSKIDIIVNVAGPLAKEYGNTKLLWTCRSTSSWCHCKLW